jgi:peptidoglycan/LPS O-acetylase OafA/YrhL
METKRVFGLDLIRAIAVLSVVFAHSASLLSPFYSLPYVGWFLENCSALGLLGVELFFVLSGFLIGSILIREYMRSTVYNVQSIKTFWIKRWSRTLPNYYFILGLNILLFSRTAFDWHFLFFTQNLSTPHPVFFPEAWSLAVEEWFYLTLPLVLLLMTRLLKGVAKQRILKTTCLVYLAIFTTIRIINAYHPSFGDLGQDAGIRKIIVFRLDAIIYGVIIAYFNYFHAALLKQSKVKNTLFFIGISSTFVLVVLSYWGYDPRLNYYNNSPIFRFLSDAFLYSLLPMSLSFVLPFALFMNAPPVYLSRLNKAITHISLISYSMYLIHYSLVLAFFQKLHTSSMGSAFALYCAYWCITISVSTVIYYFYEKPTIHLLRGRLLTSAPHLDRVEQRSIAQH